MLFRTNFVVGENGEMGPGQPIPQVGRSPLYTVHGTKSENDAPKPVAPRPGVTSTVSDTRSGSTAMTRLRVIGEPTGEFLSTETWSGVKMYLQKVSVSVRNVGSSGATRVVVQATLPGGKTVNLYGPTTVAPNSTATYTGSMYEPVRTAEKIKARVSCANCWTR